MNTPVSISSRRQWFSFDDDDGTWMFDITFLTSTWNCIFGRGCQGVLTGPAEELGEGCCSYGAHFNGAPERRRVKAAAERLRHDQWHNANRLRGLSPIARGDDGGFLTRLIDDACVFLNPPHGSAEPGCALHIGAIEAGERPMDWKPDVCWQVPLRFEQSDDELGYTTFTVREWKRRDWGDGGAEFHWWCTEEPEAYDSAIPVYLQLEDELRALVGDHRFRALDSFIRDRASTSMLTASPDQY